MEHTKDIEQVLAKCNEFASKYFSEEKTKLWCESGGLPSNVYREFYRSGLGAYVLSVSAGGIDCPFIDRVTVLERLTHLAGATLPMLSDMLTWSLLASMSEQSQLEIIDDFRMRDEVVLFSLAFTEPGAGSDVQAIRTTVSAEGDELYLDGLKTFVSAGQFTPRSLILARDPISGQVDGGMSLWLVPTDLPGVSAMPFKTIGQEMLCPASVRFDHVRLDPNWKIQTQGRLNTMIKRQYALGRVLVCASSLGLAKAAFDDMLYHAGSHRVKGSLLGSLPQMQEKIADMTTKIWAMDKFVVNAAKQADIDDIDALTLSTSMMKYYVPKTATEVASEALQIFGGIGYTDQTRVSRIWRDCRGNQIAQGTDEVMVHYIASSMVRKAQSGALDHC